LSETEVTEPEKKPKRKRTLLQRIVNAFLYVGVVTLGIFIFIFGFSQTQTFRNWLRNFVVEQANNNLNGKISIEKIEGTIFTSLILHNTVVTMEKDTLLNAGMIELRTSPLKIFLKTIHVRKVEIKDARIAFVKDSLGELNILKLFPPPDEDEDTSKSSFPFRIEVADFKLTNVDFSLQKFDKVGSDEIYSSMNMDDFRLDDVFLSLRVFADIDNNTFETKIEYLSLSPNIKAFNLKSFSGEFGVNPKEIIANNLILNTENSDITLNAKVNGLDIFDSTMTENLKYAVVSISLNSHKFNFNDISSFVPPIEMLKGAVGVQINASGNLIQLDINKIVLDYEKTHLETKAVIRNIDNIDEMTISADFKNSYIVQSDIDKLLPEFGIPVFEKLGVVKIDSLTFNGRPLNFKSKILLSANDGKISSDLKMDLEKPIAEYDINFSSMNFDLSPIAGIQSKLNVRGNFIGKGFSPKEMNSNILLVGDGSTIEGIKLDSLSLTAQAKDGIINYSLFSATGKARADIDGSLDFLQENLGYKAVGKVSDLDIGELMKDSASVTDLNFKFRTEGENFDIDKMNMFLTFDLAPSKINGIEVDSTRTITDIFTDDNEDRVINFISDIADITLKGQFSLPDAISVLSRESDLLTNAFMKKIAEVMPSAKLDRYLVEQNKAVKSSSVRNSKKAERISIIYLVDLKDFRFISPFLKDKRLEIDGDLSGKMVYDDDSIFVTLNSNLNYVKYWGNTDVYFLSKMNLDLDFANSFLAESTEDVNLDLQVKTNRIFAGTDLNNVLLDLKMRNNIADINFSTKLENYASAKLSCLADLRTSTLKLDIDTLNLVYKGFDIKNREKLNLLFAENRIDFNKFKLFHSNGEISATGFLAANENQNLNLKISNIQGKDLFQSFSGGNGLSFLDINLNLNAVITGNYARPLMSIGLSGENLTYKEKKFGNFTSNFSYADRIFTSDIKFFDSYSNSSIPALKLIGNIPINLSFTDSGKRLIDDEEINLNLISNNLDLTPFGELIPGLSKFKGMLNSNLQVSGTIQEAYPDGYLTLDNSSFLLKYNNLEYLAGLKISIAKDYLSVDSLLLANSTETISGGRITGGGKAELDNFNITSSQFALNGKLKVLGEETKYVSPNLYGDLVISTDGNVELRVDKSGAKLKAPINVEVAKLTYSQAQGSYTSTSENFIYKFIEDTITNDSKEMDFEKLINLSKLSSLEEQQQTSKLSKFDYSIDVKVEDEATLTFILSREFNQNLVAVLRGNFQYESIGGKPIAQGELQLLDGSTLEFIKTFSAEGKIRFESELSNPFLDIIATYKNYYYPLEISSNGEGDQSGGDEVEVAIKMKVKGALKELDKNLAQQSEKLTVYVGTKNIENNISDPTKDASDAVMFMILNKFNDNVTQQERNMVSTYAATFAGSIVGGFLNRQFGDYVKNLDIRQTGTDTKFILGGRAGKFRYSIGGSTAVFQDLGLANVKIEYPITRSFFMRLERKEALSETRYINEMINELGLKYRFEF
jgi:hypothetical protein